MDPRVKPEGDEGGDVSVILDASARSADQGDVRADGASSRILPCEAGEVSPKATEGVS